MYAERASELPPPRRHRKVYTPEGISTRNGKPRWGQAGVSMSAEILFNWWLTHDSWETFKAKLEHPKLFEEDE